MVNVKGTTTTKIPWKNIIMIILVLLYVALNIALAHDSDLIFSFNSFVTVALVLSVLIHALIVLVRVPVGVNNRIMYGGLTIGLVLWCIAETWWGVAGLIGSKVPYPSPADIFWLLGYIPMYVAFWLRVRSLPKVTGLLQKISYFAAALVIMGWVVGFVLIPILRNGDSEALLESILNVAYPIADLVNILFILRIFFAYRQGMYGKAWAFLSVGFGLNAFSDLLFTYSTNMNLYYPNGEANLLSVAGVDISYNLGYISILIAFLVLRNMNIDHKVTQVAFNLHLPSLTHLLISTSRDDLVIYVSDNFSRLFSAVNANGASLAKTLGMEPEVGAKLIHAIKTQDVLEEQTVAVETIDGPSKVKISGLAYKPDGEYSGAFLLIRLTTKESALNCLMSDYQSSVAGFVAQKTRAAMIEEEEIKQFLAHYYQVYFQAFYNCLVVEGGSILADAFITELTVTAKQKNPQMKIINKSLLDVGPAALSEVVELLPALFDDARQFVAKTIDTANADAIIADITSHFDPDLRREVSRIIAPAAAQVSPVKQPVPVG